jgi:hypothetical protein
VHLLYLKGVGGWGRIGESSVPHDLVRHAIPISRPNKLISRNVSRMIAYSATRTYFENNSERA